MLIFCFFMAYHGPMRERRVGLCSLVSRLVDNNLLSDFNGVSLSGGDILVNPDLDLARELKGWWDSEGCKQEMASITVSGSRGSDGPGGPAKIIGEVKQENLGHGERGDYYSVISTVTFFRCVQVLFRETSVQLFAIAVN